MPRSRKDSLRSTPAPSSQATTSPLSKIHWCSVRARDGGGARVTAVLPDGRASYDGRATAEENFFERTGLAYHSGEPGRLRHADSEPVDIRYLDVLPLPDGAFRIYYETRLADESHELRTEIVPPQTGYGQEAN